MRILKSLNKIIITVFILFTTIASIRASASNTDFSLQQITEYIDLNMESGSSLRLVDDSTGIRFISHINNTEYLSLKEQYKLSFGTLILPKDKITELTDATFTKEYLNANSISYLNIHQEHWYKIDESSNLRYFSGVIVNILDKNLNRDFIARSYCDLEIKGLNYTFYSKSSLDNSRNIYDLAQVVIEHDSLSTNQVNILYSLLNRVGISLTIVSVSSETKLQFTYDFTNNFYIADYSKIRVYMDYVSFTISPKNDKYSLEQISTIHITGKGGTSDVTHNSNGTITFLYSIDKYIYSDLH